MEYLWILILMAAMIAAPFIILGVIKLHGILSDKEEDDGLDTVIKEVKLDRLPDEKFYPAKDLEVVKKDLPDFDLDMMILEFEADLAEVAFLEAMNLELKKIKLKKEEPDYARAFEEAEKESRKYGQAYLLAYLKLTSKTKKEFLNRANAWFTKERIKELKNFERYKEAFEEAEKDFS